MTITYFQSMNDLVVNTPNFNIKHLLITSFNNSYMVRNYE